VFKKAISYIRGLMQMIKIKMQNDEIKKFTLESFPFWVASISAGLIAVLYSNIFHWVEVLQSKFDFERAWWIFIIAPVGFFVSWWLVHRFSPSASGSGIPQLMAGIHYSGQKNGSKEVLKLLSVKVIFI